MSIRDATSNSSPLAHDNDDKKSITDWTSNSSLTFRLPEKHYRLNTKSLQQSITGFIIVTTIGHPSVGGKKDGTTVGTVNGIRIEYTMYKKTFPHNAMDKAAAAAAIWLFIWLSKW